MAPSAAQLPPTHPILGMAWLLLFWTLGMLLERWLIAEIPSAIYGLLTLFIGLQWIPDAHRQAIYRFSDGLLANMTLFFLPAGAGLLFLPESVQVQLLGVLLVMIVSTGISIILSGWLLKRLAHTLRHNNERP